MEKNIGNIRKEYSHAQLDLTSISKNPIEQFKIWLEEAIYSQVNEPTAMNLATISSQNRPTSRIVLLKEVGENGFIFFTNYNSEKGKSIAYCPFVAIDFFWPELERQVRIEGKAEKISTADSDAYFKSRPIGSQIGAWASSQSSVIETREILESNVIKYTTLFKGEINRPPHWGGYLVKPDKIEFWQGRLSRLHDRIVFTKEDKDWKIERLAP
ncbi:MAG TPA: pyridoxamine 5'-phosphate oxidase [Cytophagales bacterium]|nr:pyridoxamine 5'-phosphate oxidase [Cytophagales bacterium]